MDECDMDIRFCRNLQCKNTVGTYTCGCRQGFDMITFDSDATCADINECLNRNTCPENSVCQNLEGDYKCLCESGFEGETCLDVDECTSNKTTCDINADCHNTQGSFKQGSAKYNYKKYKKRFVVLVQRTKYNQFNRYRLQARAII